MSTSSSQGFGKFRSLFCPVHKSELKLFLPLVLIFFSFVLIITFYDLQKIL
ncbi:MAG: NTP/NDP exchange transporter [Rhabdochlamydiaceae bacterium]